MKERRDYHWSRLPTAKHRHILYSPEGDGLMFFASIADRDEYANRFVIMDYLDDGWAEEVELVFAGEITHIATKTNVTHKPEVTDDMSEDEIAEIEDEFGEFEYRCSYKMLPLQNAETGDSAFSNQISALAVTCKCKAAVFMAVRRGLDEAGMQEVSDLIAKGYDAKWMPLPEARALPFGCRCDEQEKPASADGE